MEKLKIRSIIYMSLDGQFHSFYLLKTGTLFGYRLQRNLLHNCNKTERKRIKYLRAFSWINPLFFLLQRSLVWVQEYFARYLLLGHIMQDCSQLSAGLLLVFMPSLGLTARRAQNSRSPLSYAIKGMQKNVLL